MERIDYSWDDQDPDQMQTWHETEGFRLNQVDLEGITFPDGENSLGDAQELSLDEETLNFLDAFKEWLAENFLAQEVDILLSMPVHSIHSTLRRGHPDIARLMMTYGLSTDELRDQNLRLRLEVHKKLKIQGLEEAVPWQIVPDMLNIFAESYLTRRFDIAD